MPRFRTLMTVSAILAGTLTVTLSLVPALVFTLFSVTTDPSGDFVARRAAALFLGIAVLSFMSRDLAASAGREAVAAGISVMMLALALLGTLEWLRGYAGAGIFLAVAGETGLGLGLLAVWLGDRAERLGVARGVSP